jgi:signal transduction histidine kinase
LASYCAELQRQQALEVTFSAQGDVESMDKTVALCLYRVAQEALRNVVAHAQASRAEVRLRRADDGAELMIADDGRGFDIVKARERGGGLGLISIDERVRLAGGTVSIVTKSFEGTQVGVRIPMTPPAKAGDGHQAGQGATLA